MPRRAFLITPLSPETAGNEEPETYDAVQAALQVASSENDLDLKRADDIFASGVVIEQIRGEIEQAELIIAVCTGRNANVFYELGLAEAAGKPQILIAASRPDLPFDIGHLRAQMYGEGSPGLDTLSVRVSKAIQETLLTARSADFRTPADSEQSSVELEKTQGENPLNLVRTGDSVGFIEFARSLVQTAQERHREAAQANVEVTPNPEVLQSLGELRDSSAEAVIAWLEPAIEYNSDYLERPLRELSDAFGASLFPGSRLSFWESMHRAWIALALKASLAVALRRERPDALHKILRLRPPTNLAERDEAPLVLNPSFTFNPGYLGDARVGFDDFLRFASVSETLGKLFTGDDERTNLVCGTDLVLGLARWIIEESPGQPSAYAGFAAYYCQRISQTARLLETSEEMAQAIGADSLADLRQKARKGYPLLVERIEPGRRHNTCDSWEQVISMRV